MHSIVYFDLSPKKSRMGFKNGVRIDLEDIISRVIQSYPDVFALQDLPTILGRTTFEPTRQWQDVLQAVLLAITGLKASIDELRVMRSLLYTLPSEYKRSFTDPWQSIGLIAYLLIGFRMHIVDRHKEDSNSVNDLARFISLLRSSSEAHVSSFLCSHRGKSIPGGSWLADVEEVPREKIHRAISLQLALLANASHLKERSISWVQQGPSPFASSTIFPELFLRYAEQGLVPDMLLTLAKQERFIQQEIEAGNPTSIRVNLISIDPFLVSVLRFMRGTFGRKWRTTDFLVSRSPRMGIVDIALTSALPEVMRLMPFYANSKTKQRIADEDRYLQRNLDRAVDLPESHLMSRDKIRSFTKQTIRLFALNQGMHPSAKAVYETVFYYLWGRRCAQKSGSFAIGLDRDHSRFQQEAWELGYEEGREERCRGVVLYARRVERVSDHGSMLNDLSFRQFWR